MNYHELALPWRMPLRHTVDWFKCFRYDWVHTLLQDGPLMVDMFEYVGPCQEIAYFPEVKDWLS